MPTPLNANHTTEISYTYKADHHTFKSGRLAEVHRVTYMDYVI